MLLRGGLVYRSGATSPAALLLSAGRVAWVGSEQDAGLVRADRTIQLEGALVTPGFVDSHVHATATGLALTGLDLTGATSLPDALSRVRSYVERHPSGIVLGSGWDESTWPERRPPTRTELDDAGHGRATYLTRVDVHSALASSALMAEVPQCFGVDGSPRDDADAQVRLSAHHLVRSRAMGSVGPAQRSRAQRATLEHAAAGGIALVVEMAGPDVSSEADLAALLGEARLPGTVGVKAYWGELGRTDIVREWGLAGAGGDLFADGAIGSRTAALGEPYADDPAAGCGHLWFGADEVADHVRACTRAGIQAGFHAIGDAAVGAVIAGVERVAADLGRPAVRRLHHRIEHCEMLDADLIRRMSALGLVASVQPVFDRLWGGADRLYADRLGARAGGLNPFASLATAGVRLAFGSDAPVTPLDGWAAVHAAVHHHQPAQRVSARAAMTAATRGGRLALGSADGGFLETGALADLAVWSPTESGRPDPGPSGLPAGVVGPGASYEPPACLATVVGGRTVYAAAGWSIDASR